MHYQKEKSASVSIIKCIFVTFIFGYDKPCIKLRFNTGAVEITNISNANKANGYYSFLLNLINLV